MGESQKGNAMKIGNRTGEALTLCVALVLFQTFVAAANDPVERPNVIIILADDLGCSDGDPEAR